MSHINERLVQLSDSSTNFDSTHQFVSQYTNTTSSNRVAGVLDPWQQSDETESTTNDTINMNNNNNNNAMSISSSSNCVRKLETISHYVASIFDNNFKEAKKNLNSAYRALRDPRSRLHLGACLQRYVRRNQVILNNEQFEYVVKCLNESLSHDTRYDEHGVAYALLPLATAFYRKLNNGTVDQCIFTRLQAHDVWSNMQFWEMAFYTDVQRSLRPVYLSNEEFAAEQQRQQQSSTSSSSDYSPANNPVDGETSTTNG